MSTEKNVFTILVSVWLMVNVGLSAFKEFTFLNWSAFFPSNQNIFFSIFGLRFFIL